MVVDAEYRALKIRALKQRLDKMDKGESMESCAADSKEVGVTLETIRKLSWSEIADLWPLRGQGRGG